MRVHALLSKISEERASRLFRRREGPLRGRGKAQEKDAMRAALLKIYDKFVLLLVFSGFVVVGETYRIGVEIELYRTNGAVPVLGNHNLCDISRMLLLFLLFVFVFAVNEHHHVCILLKRSRFTKIGKTGPGRKALFHGAREL